MIHMKLYSICINNIFCFVLNPKKLICPQISWEFGNFNDQNNINKSKNVSFEVLYRYIVIQYSLEPYM